MRAIVSILVACALFVLVGYLAYSGTIVLSDFWTGVAVALVVTALGVLYWGFRPKIGGFFREKRNSQESKAITAPTEKETALLSQGSALLPDSAQMTRLSVDEGFLDEIYEQAHRKAIDIYHDAQLSCFTIQVWPFMIPKVNIYLDFYSKWADKSCTFVYSDRVQRVKHSPPDKPPKFDSDKEVFTTLPWKKNPQWKQFLDRVYVRIGPFATALGTSYHLHADPTRNTNWWIKFNDDFTGKEYSFSWDGKGLDENSIKRLS